MKRRGRIGVVTSIGLIFLMAISLLVVLLPHLLGMSFTIAKDHKMAPTYPEGSLIFVKKEKPENILVGEIITYYVNQGENIKTRRVVAKEEEFAFYTKGDGADQMEVGLVSSRNLIGQPVWHLPYVGHFVSRRVIQIAIIIFWMIAGFLTVTTLGLMVEQLAAKPKRKQSNSRF
ncbi:MULTISPECIES: signal peptidase I [Enterococcus]|uniref:signal peptidase I n=1 Tax=Enterococcus TaxID=1350 RepID=UPI000ABA3798|nr:MULTISPECIES: signal peptidase I [Enterococcus]